MKDFPKDLLAGYGRFRDKTYPGLREQYNALAIYGQDPKVMVISCCDSRVSPEGIFNAGPGELFVVRNVANLVPGFEDDLGTHGTSAAIEYAVTGLEVQHIVVLGHCKCGGVQAFRARGIASGTPGQFLGPWIKLLEPAAIELACNPVEPNEDPQLGMEYAGIRQSLKNLRTFPFIEKRLADKHLQLHGAWFDIGAGELRVMDKQTSKFIPAVELLPGLSVS
ncbi:carbonic anhydrase [Pseudovibrio exalbescens]|uniref:Carbonic anhydrase n=1 Tax=Pseudovibrio exalbescens TaxID=197461 RepID=A0A1U7JGQ6_9HYPH|nr:carbonic anhydrase [Pseudovibrio exalbescens]OKL43919.1 carbonate dehydratase [Pseudovibrio exalbescens]